MKKIVLLLLATLFVMNIGAQDVPADIASVKPNDWQKDESMADRLKRTIDNGNCIGVVFDYECLKDKYASDEYLKLGNILVEKAKRYYKTDKVELVDISKIPKTGKDESYYKWHQVYRFWDTKYKFVLWFKSSIDLKSLKATSSEAAAKNIYYTHYEFIGWIYPREFYIKKGKEKSDGNSLPLNVGLKSNKISTSGKPNSYWLSKVIIPNEVDLMRIVQNNIEEELTKWTLKKLEYSVEPQYVKPNLPENMVSKAENKPVKGEIFSDKINRIKAGGNAIAVELNITDESAYFSDGSTSRRIGTPRVIKEKETLERVGPDFVKRLNESYSTTIFELVDVTKFPYQLDMNESKYKILIRLNIYPSYSAECKYNETAHMYDSEFKFYTAITVQAYEYHINEKGKSKEQSILPGGLSFKSYKKETESQQISSGDKSSIYGVSSMEKWVERDHGEEYVKKIEEIINEEYPKLIKQLNK